MISKYETLAKVVELGSLTRAAEALGCTQSAVSHAINGLEKEFGFAVLTRSRAGVHLTADGERIMPSIRGMLNYEEQLKQTVSAIRGLDFGTVRIGAFTSVAVHWLPGVIKEFQRDYPNVDIKLLNGDYHDVEQWIMGVRVSAVCRRTSLPTLWLPVKKTKSNFCSSRAAFSSLPPVTTATYRGSKHSLMSFLIRSFIPSPRGRKMDRRTRARSGAWPSAPALSGHCRSLPSAFRR